MSGLNTNFLKKSFAERSNNVKNIFTRTVKELEQINKEASIEHQRKHDEIAKLTEEANEISDVISSNYKLIDKITNLLS